MKALIVALIALGAASFGAASFGAAMAGDAPPASYYDRSGRADAWSGGARMISINTADGAHPVWVKRVGSNPKLKVLILHGGPGGSHDLYEGFDSFLPAAGVEYYYYDQLGSGNSDHPTADLWTLDRFVDEVEQVRVALGLDASNFCLFGHSWGGLLAIEYALKHQDKMKCLVVSNMMASIPAYNRYAAKVLAKQMDPAVRKEIEAKKDYANPRYMALLLPNFYEKHILRRPQAEWPEPVARGFSKLNSEVYTLMQGPSEFRASGRLENWDRTKELRSIKIPTLTIGGTYDTMDPRHMQWMAGQFPQGRYLATQGSHLAIYDDQQRYMDGLIAFLKDVERR